ncbi:MAG: DUF1549 and DUF1553 domain-containing protein [Planctomycetaceae bacterium]|nr:DUF1549 and DUF1553 domain-containing protein [Planctomycetaceae bacterium]
MFDRCRRLALLMLAAVAPGLAAAADVSFRNDVMAVLSKAGCNQGTCHGNARGKGGFQLSLRGQDPANDYQVLTRDWLTRRTNVAEPDRSLLLLKATMQMAHEGGQRFAVDSDEYRVLRDWIANGLPTDPEKSPRLTTLDVTPTAVILEAPQWEQPLRVRARFSDGSERDLTSRAVYEVGSPIVEVTRDGMVRGQSAGETVVLVRYLDRQVPVRISLIPARPEFVWNGPKATNVVDEYVFAKLRQLKLLPSDLCDDATFLRRTHLDLIGVLPTADEARAFLADASADKRTKLVDDLLQRPEFADWWALKWADMLRVEEKTLDAKGAAVFHEWLRTAFAEGRPLDELVKQLIASRGSTYSEPEANFYRALRDPFARSEAVGQLFLGVRLQCAKCHNHPFDRWTQDDYYSWANVFAKVDYKILENNRRDTNDKHEFDGEQIVFMADKGDVDDPRTNQPRPPQFLGDAGALPAESDRLERLADWLTRPDNDRFSQMLVNRAWRNLFGRGLVEPVDDFRATNPPTHPELLAALAADLRSHGFDLRHLLRVMTTSTTYQLSSLPNENNAADEVNYSHATVRRLTAEQLADGLSQACGVPIAFQGYPEGMRAGELPGVGAMLRRRGGGGLQAGDELLRVFGKPPRLQSCECERSDETTLNQAFQLVSGGLMHQLTSSPGNRLAALTSQDVSVAVTELYWHTLSRPPTETERQAVTEYVTRHDDRTAALQDVLWSLVTSHEFVLRR